MTKRKLTAKQEMWKNLLERAIKHFLPGWRLTDRKQRKDAGVKRSKEG
jgi:hypothetical protein